MNSHFAGFDISVNALRGTLTARASRGEKLANQLLRAVSHRSETTAGDLVTHYLRQAGSAERETVMAGVGLVSLGLVLGIIALTASGFVTADLETLIILLAAFATGQWGLFHYTKMSTARLYAQELQKIANIAKVSDLVRQQYSAATHREPTKQTLAFAYGEVA